MNNSTRLRTMFRLSVPALALAAVIGTAAIAQAPSESRRGEPITAQERGQVIDRLAKELHDTYVFPDVADKAVAAIRTHQKANEYDSMTDGQEFAHALTEHLRDICHDAHLHVSYSPDTLPVRKANDQPSAAEIAQYRDQVRRSNAGYEKVERLPGNIGYIKVIGFSDAEDAHRPAQAAMEFVANTDALIFDLRENHGGAPNGVQLLCSYLFGKKPVHLNSIYTRVNNKTTEYWSLAKVDGPRYLGREVYVLTSPRCGSAGEEFCYNLQTQKRATLIGDRTWGGANPGGNVRLDDHFSAFVPHGRAINPITKTNWEGTGVIPDIKVEPKDALAYAHRLAVETLLKKATTPEDKDRLTEVLKELGEGR